MTIKPEDFNAHECLVDFFLASGVDCFLDEESHDRFAETLKAQEQRRAQFLSSGGDTAHPSTSPKSQIPKTPQSTTPRFITPSHGTSASVDPGNVEEARSLAAKAADLDALKAVLSDYEGCSLKRTAKNLVFGTGNPEAKIMFVGEAPGRDEDMSGIPFIGRSGQLLDRMLSAIGLERDRDTYIANIVPWRPPGNRTPTPFETEICRPFIERQIELVAPDLIVLLGGASAKQLLQTNDGILKTRGKEKSLSINSKSFPAVATLHPAYLLRQPQQKRLAWMDLLMIRRLLGVE